MPGRDIDENAEVWDLAHTRGHAATSTADHTFPGGTTTYLRGDGTWQTVSSGGTPSGTVVTETAFGQGAASGTSTEYSRGDHTHGTPAAPGGSTPSGTVV